MSEWNENDPLPDMPEPPRSTPPTDRAAPARAAKTRRADLRALARADLVVRGWTVELLAEMQGVKVRSMEKMLTRDEDRLRGLGVHPPTPYSDQ